MISNCHAVVTRLSASIPKNTHLPPPQYLCRSYDSNTKYSLSTERATLCFPVISPFTQTRHAQNARLGGNCFQFSANVPLDSRVDALDFGGFNSPWELCNKLQPITCNFRRAWKERMNESNSEEEHYIYKQFTIIIIIIITNRFRNFIVKELEVYRGVSFSTLLITRLDNTLNLCKHF